MNFTIFILKMDDHTPIFNAKLCFFEIHKPDFRRCNYLVVNVYHADSTMKTSLMVVEEVP